MKLTGPEIQKQMEWGSIVIDPFIPEHMGPNSYDLRLDNRLLVYKTRPTVLEHPHPIFGVGFIRSQNVAEILAGDIYREGRGPSDCGFPAELCAGWENILDMAKDTPTYELIIPETGLVLLPGRLYIGSTVEYTETHQHVPCIEGRSSVGRLGINVHSTAGFGDVGFKGTWTLEISVVEPVRIYPGIRCCQIYYDSVEGDIAKTYSSDKYQGQRGPRSSAMWKEFVKDGGVASTPAKTTPREPGGGTAGNS